MLVDLLQNDAVPFETLHGRYGESPRLAGRNDAPKSKRLSWTLR
jgi:hypothetical protein